MQNKWIIINGDQHTKIDDFTEGLRQLNELSRLYPSKSIHLLREDEYLESGYYKRKRGKKA
jgi:hypothetical protein